MTDTKADIRGSPRAHTSAGLLPPLAAWRVLTPRVCGVQVQVLRYDLPLARPGDGAGAVTTGVALDADHRPGNLRVRLVEAEGLATRPDGTACQPYATITVAELTRRRTRRTRAPGPGPTVAWGAALDFEDASACAQIVIDVFDEARAGPAELLGKALLNLSECRPGVPHTYFKHMLEGKLVLRVLFDFEPLPSPADEQAAFDSQYGEIMRR